MKKRKGIHWIVSLYNCVARGECGVIRVLLLLLLCVLMLSIRVVSSPTGTTLCRHAGIILKDDVSIVVKVEKSQRREDIRDATRSRYLRMTADSVHDTLDSSVIGRVQFLHDIQSITVISIQKQHRA